MIHKVWLRHFVRTDVLHGGGRFRSVCDGADQMDAFYMAKGNRPTQQKRKPMLIILMQLIQHSLQVDVVLMGLLALRCEPSLSQDTFCPSFSQIMRKSEIRIHYVIRYAQQLFDYILHEYQVLYINISISISLSRQINRQMIHLEIEIYIYVDIEISIYRYRYIIYNANILLIIL